MNFEELRDYGYYLSKYTSVECVSVQRTLQGLREENKGGESGMYVETTP